MHCNDGTVVHEDVLGIIRGVNEIGWRAAFDKLANEEPALAGYAMAASDLLAERLGKAGVPNAVLKLIEQRMMTAQLVCIESMRQGSRQLWQDFLPGAEPDVNK